MFLLSLSLAHAFCGTYVGDVGSDLSNGASRIGIVREGKTTTLTLFNDFQGNASDFAMLIPVPVVLQKEDVKQVSSDIVARWDSFSAPREVSYTCEDFMPPQFGEAGGSGGCFLAQQEMSLDMAASAAMSDSATTVEVESEFTVGAYDIVVLSAEDSSGLLNWLDQNQYAVDASAADLLQEYIDAGTYFFAAKVHLEGIEPGSAWLPPLQFSYTADGFSLPIRLGALNGKEMQDLILYILTPLHEGGVGISNYPEVSVDDECMFLPEDGESVSDYYTRQLEDALAMESRPGWITEFSTEGMGCDPCSIELGEQDASDLGFSQSIWESHLTRLHLRYDPALVDQDLVFYTGATNEDPLSQIRYIQYNESMEDRFEVCGIGMVENPGTCPDQEDATTENKSGCTASTAFPNRIMAGIFAALAVLTARRQRRGVES